MALNSIYAGALSFGIFFVLSVTPEPSEHSKPKDKVPSTEESNLMEICDILTTGAPVAIAVH